MTNRQIARRTLLTRTGLVDTAFGTGLAAIPARASADRNIVSQAHVASKGDVKLAVYRKFLGTLEGQPDKPLPILFLVHGSDAGGEFRKILV